MPMDPELEAQLEEEVSTNVILGVNTGRDGVRRVVIRIAHPDGMFVQLEMRPEEARDHANTILGIVNEISGERPLQ